MENRSLKHSLTNLLLHSFLSLNNVWNSADTTQGIQGRIPISTIASEPCPRPQIISSLQDSISASLPGKPKIRRFRSIDPTAMYLASGPNFTLVALPKTRWIVSLKAKMNKYDTDVMKHRAISNLRPRTKDGRLSKRNVTCARHIRESFDSVPFVLDTSSLEDSAKVPRKYQ